MNDATKNCKNNLFIGERFSKSSANPVRKKKHQLALIAFFHLIIGKISNCSNPINTK